MSQLASGGAMLTRTAGLASWALEHGQPVQSVLSGVLPLHVAAGNGHLAIVQLLLKHGADVNAPRLSRKYSKERVDAAPGKMAVGTTGTLSLADERTADGCQARRHCISQLRAARRRCLPGCCPTRSAVTRPSRRRPGKLPRCWRARRATQRRRNCSGAGCRREGDYRSDVPRHSRAGIPSCIRSGASRH